MSNIKKLDERKRKPHIEWPTADEGDLVRLKCISLVLKSYPEILKFIFKKDEPRLSMSPEKILDELSHLSSGEMALTRVALDIWNGDGNANYSSLVYELSEQNFKRVVVATGIMRELVFGD